MPRFNRLEAGLQLYTTDCSVIECRKLLGRYRKYLERLEVKACLLANGQKPWILNYSRHLFKTDRPFTAVLESRLSIVRIKSLTCPVTVFYRRWMTLEAHLLKFPA